VGIEIARLSQILYGRPLLGIGFRDSCDLASSGDHPLVAAPKLIAAKGKVRLATTGKATAAFGRTRLSWWWYESAPEAAATSMRDLLVGLRFMGVHWDKSGCHLESQGLSASATR